MKATFINITHLTKSSKAYPKGRSLCSLLLLVRFRSCMQWCHWNLELYPACLKFKINFFFSQLQVECFELHYDLIFSSFILSVIWTKFLLLQIFWHLLELPEEFGLAPALLPASTQAICFDVDVSPIISSSFPSFKGSKVVSPQISKNLFNFNCNIHHLFNVCISSDSAQFADFWPQFSYAFTSYYLAYHNIFCTLSLGSCLTASGWCLCCVQQHLHTAESSKSTELPNLLMRNSTSWTIFSSSCIT